MRWGLDTEDDGVGWLIVDVDIWIFFGPGILHHLILCASAMMPLFNLERHDICTADKLPCAVENSISECQKKTVKGVSQYVRLFPFIVSFIPISPRMQQRHWDHFLQQH